MTFHLFISGSNFGHLWAKICNDIIWESRTVKLMGVTLDDELKFDENLSNVCLIATSVAIKYRMPEWLYMEHGTTNPKCGTQNR